MLIIVPPLVDLLVPDVLLLLFRIPATKKKKKKLDQPIPYFITLHPLKEKESVTWITK